MPQMAPINWIFLFIMFILTYIFFNILNYYIFNINFKSTEKSSLKIPFLTWKW